MDKLTQTDANSHDIVADNIDKLKAIFPEAFTEGKIDFDVLKETLGEYRETREERYNFSWAGKSKARRLAQTPTTGTLRPCPEESVDWDKTENLFIEGDNLEVLKLLQKSYQGQVKMIYIDPPYNTGKEFIYPDKFQDNLETYLKFTGQKSDEGIKVSSNTESSGRYHTNWLNMIYPRLKLARTLLADDGVLFVSIDDNEKDNLKKLCDELFGEENFLSAIIIQSNKRGQTYKEIAKCHEYLLVYYKSEEATLGELDKKDGALPFEDEYGGYDLWELRNRNPKFGRHNRPNLFFPIYVDPNSVGNDGLASIRLVKDSNHSVEVIPQNSEGTDSCWRWSTKKVQTDGIEANPVRVFAKQKRDGEWNIYEKSRKNTTKAKSIWADTSVISEQGTVEAGRLGMSGVLDFPKPIELIKRCIFLGTNEDDLIMDFFAGSGTTAHAAMLQSAEDHLRRKCISVQLPEPTYEYDGDTKVAKSQNKIAFEAGLETIAEIAKERIRRAADKLKEAHPDYNGDLGFKVFKLDSSNIEAWDSNVENLEDNVLKAANVLKDDRSELDIVYELFLKYGLDLSYPVNTHEVAGKQVYEIGAGSLFICLEDGITTDFVEGLIKLYESFDDEAAPRVVFKDSGFKTDAAKKDAESTLKDAGILDVKCL